MASFYSGPLKLRLKATPISPILPRFMFFIVQVKLDIWRLSAGNIRYPDVMDRLCHVLVVWLLCMRPPLLPGHHAIWGLTAGKAVTRPEGDVGRLMRAWGYISAPALVLGPA